MRSRPRQRRRRRRRRRRSPLRAEEADRAGPEYPNHIFPRAICQHRNILRDTEKYFQTTEKYSSWYRKIFSNNREIFSVIQKNIFKLQRKNILEIEIVIERRKDAMMQMLLRFDPSRNASGRHLPLCSTSTKILGSVLEQHTTHQCNGFIGTTLLYAMQCSRFFFWQP